jgi:predicted negative regulator of RcsB-dependent stress response
VAEYVDEREQWERAVSAAKEAAPWILAGLVIAGAGYGGWQYWSQRNARLALDAATRYERVLDAFGHNDLRTGLTLADALIKDFPQSAYAAQADLAAARVQVESDALEQAAARLRHVLETSPDHQLAMLARLRLARVQLAQHLPDAALATLNAVDAGAFAARFAAVRGDVLLAKGDRDGALREYRAARASGANTVDSGLLDLKISDLAHS